MPITFNTFLSFPFSLSCTILNYLVPIRHIARLDSACCSRAMRPLLLRMLSSRGFIQREIVYVAREKQFLWYVGRNIGATIVGVNAKLHVCEATFNYFQFWGRDIREIHFSSKDLEGLYMISMHCKNLVTVSFADYNVDILVHDVLCNNSNLEVVLFEDIALEAYVLKNIVLPKLKTLSNTGLHCVSAELCHELALLSAPITRLCLSLAMFTRPDIIPNITTRCKDLRTLDLSSTTVNNAAINEITLSCPNIVNLSLRRCEQISDAGILSIAQNLRELRTLDIRACEKIANDSIVHLMNYRASTLVVLFFNIDNVQDTTIIEFLQKCNALQTLGLEFSDDSRYAEDAEVHQIFRAISQLKHLYLQGMGLITDRMLQLVGQYCNSVTLVGLEPMDDHLQWGNEDKEYFTESGLLALQKGCTNLNTLVVYEDCQLLKNKLAIRLWQELRPGLSTIGSDSIHYDAMKCDI